MNPRSRFESPEEYTNRLHDELERLRTNAVRREEADFDRAYGTGFDRDEQLASDAYIERAEAEGA